MLETALGYGHATVATWTIDEWMGRDALEGKQIVNAPTPAPRQHMGLRERLHGWWQRYRGTSRKRQVAIGCGTIGCGTLVLVVILCVGISALVGTEITPPGGAPSTQVTPLPSPPTTAPTVPPTATRQPQAAPPLPTATPQPLPTATTSPAPTVIPTKPPAPTQTPANLSIKFKSVAIVHGGTGTVSIHTNPGAALTIKVHYVATNRDATSKSLDGTSYADSAGNHTWSWPCQTTKSGTAQVIVTAMWHGQTNRIVDTFSVE